MSQQQDKTLNNRMGEFEKALERQEKTLRDGFQSINNSIKKLSAEVAMLKKDTDTLTEGDSRHRVSPVRDDIQSNKELIDKAHRRIDNILWIVAGISIGAGIGGATILKVLFGI